jgi:hypothetical protein
VIDGVLSMGEADARFQVSGVSFQMSARLLAAEASGLSEAKPPFEMLRFAVILGVYHTDT